jgi:hypothetical protein
VERVDNTSLGLSSFFIKKGAILLKSFCNFVINLSFTLVNFEDSFISASFSFEISIIFSEENMVFVT